MTYSCTLLTVRNIDVSRNFYCSLLGLAVTADYGANIVLSDRIALQTMETWQEFIQKDAADMILPNHVMELYFEETDIEDFLAKLHAFPEITLVHPLKEHSWGQRVIRFYDPDGHVIEVGEDMAMVAQQFYAQGMSFEEIALRMQVSLPTVHFWLAKEGNEHGLLF